MAPRVAVVVFPGTNCEYDVAQALERAGAHATLVWHAQADLGGVDAVVLPGGFAHGDYLRPGALARFSPVMDGLAAFAAAGGPVLGICNGFQILAEAGLLPGALVKNRGLRFVCAPATVRVDSTSSVLTGALGVGTTLQVPVNHFSGSYVCDPDTLARMRDRGQVVLRYVENPNGSLDDIAGVASPEGNVAGLMPHPERAIDELLGSADGLPLLRSFVGAAAGARAA